MSFEWIVAAAGDGAVVQVQIQPTRGEMIVDYFQSPMTKMMMIGAELLCHYHIALKTMIEPKVT